MNINRFVSLVAATCLVLTISPNAQAKAKPKAFNGKTCTIVGTSKNDKLTGTSKADVICGLGGKDTINGLGGADTIDGGAGSDILSGGTGNDVIDGGAGTDIVNGENGNDVLTGDAGNDSLNGGSGNDILQGETGADVFAGGAGKDTVTYTEKIVDLTIDIDGKADDGIFGEKDNIKTDVENISGGSGNDTITGSSGANTISGGSGNDALSGGSGNDFIFGDNDDDLLNGQTGQDTYDGGDGLNSCYVEQSEVRDFTCSLLPNLSYLLKRVSGKVTSPGLNFDGCKISLYRFNSMGGPVVSAPIYRDGNFQFDAPAGDYNWEVSGQSSTCEVNLQASIYATHQVVGDNTPFISFDVPRLVQTRVYVKNSIGTPLMGALLYMSTHADSLWPSNHCPVAVTNMCGNYSYIVNDLSSPSPRTNSSGFYEAYLPEGVKISQVRAQVSFSGITMETNTVRDFVLSYPISNIDLVIQ